MVLVSYLYLHLVLQVLQSTIGICVSEAAKGASGAPVLGNAMLCVAEVLTGLGAHAISSLPTLMPLLLTVAQNVQQQDQDKT